MLVTLVQKHEVEGTREFRLVEDELQYTIQTPLKTDSLSVVLSALDSEPVISASTLAFVSRVNREPLVELFRDMPDRETFDRFVKTMQRRISEEDFSRLRVGNKGVAVDAGRLEESIGMLQTYINSPEIDGLLSALIALSARPDDVECLVGVAGAFNELGFVQGQVITYAPYINFLLSNVNEQDDQADIDR